MKRLTLILALAMCACQKRDQTDAKSVDVFTFPENEGKPGQILVTGDDKKFHWIYQDPDWESKLWNDYRKGVSCAGMNESRICSDVAGGPDYKDKPPHIPEGYRAVFYTSGCFGCATGWVLVKGRECLPENLNCFN